ncbi:MAG: endo-beta-N-acetylglucosaminidase [Bacteroidetes bacterium]|uniref:Endo-beta-N-acetylglucosaminidase n=1 Tax=Candidatus Cryptobacteroides merdavium TaxID=2840769 RepID=A0A9D9HAN4_9BACT|nr:endo-beta-N-acetylglucosaminidase [Candidatus Cryptobacteroides merdavium]
MNIFKSAAIAAAVLSTVGCSEWMTPEAEVYDEYSLTEVARDDAYYAAIRAYKESDHAIAFGWYDSWGEPGISTANMLSAVPDSMDIISLWNNSRPLSDAKKEDLRFVQEKKGTKVLICTFVQKIGNGFTPSEYEYDTSRPETVAAWNEYWGWTDNPANKEDNKPAIEKYAKAISDTLYHYGYDGLDIDLEPNIDATYGPLDEDPTYLQWLFEALSKYIGPKSGTGRLFVIDGELWEIPVETCTCFDYFVSQAYSVSGGTPSPSAGVSASNMDYRLSQIVSRFCPTYMTEEEVTNKFVITENLESAIDCLNGGFYWTDIQGRRWSKSVMPSYLGMASWEPSNGFRKGGFGAYKFSNERSNTPMYKWLRRGIQQQNPSSPDVDIVTDDDFVAAN